ncbi:hypothetical protein ACQR3P_28545 [Rhodococcus sp. IEGM1300]
MAIVLAVDGKSQFRKKQGVMPDFSGSSQAYQESPAGTVNNTNQVFTLVNTPIVRSEIIWKNGMVMKRGVDYMLEGKTITFAVDQVPQIGCSIAVDYRFAKVV